MMQKILRKQALEGNLQRYFTGKICKRGHISERYTNNAGCVSCALENASKWVENNLEKRRIASRNWEKRNPDKKQAWLRANSDKVKRYKNNCNNKRKESGSLAISRKTWKENNPHTVRADGAKRRAQRLKATPSWVNNDELKRIYLECPTGMEVDHELPLRNSLICGLHVPWNLQYLTPQENRLKGNKFIPYEEVF